MLDIDITNDGIQLHNAGFTGPTDDLAPIYGADPCGFDSRVDGTTDLMTRGLTRTARLGAVAILSVAAFAFPAAASAADFTWSGASTTSTNWSDSGNWSGNVAPASNASIGTLSFPFVSSCPSGSACHSGHNDVSGLSANELQLETAYSLDGNGITLGAGGLTSSGPGVVAVGAGVTFPIALSASQTWQCGCAALVVAGGLSGSTSSLTLEITGAEDSGFGGITLGGDNEVGPVVVNGHTGGSMFQLGGEGLPTALNFSNDHSVTLNNIAFNPFGGSVGALTTNSARLNIGIGGLTARSATFDSASTLTFVVGSSGQGGGTDLSSTGAIDLGGAQLALNSCGPLPVGQTFTLVSTTGTLTGAFGNAPNGSTFTLDECGSTSYFRIDYQETGSPQTVTATVIAPPGSFNPPRVATGPATSEVIPEVVPPNEDHHGPQAASAWLSGAIVPGDRPVSYHFEIATVPPETLNDGCAANTGSGAIRCFVTPEQQFGSGPVAQHIGPGSFDPPTYWPGPYGPEGDILTLYHPWFYRLVASDGVSQVPGNTAEFVPANLINPPNFDPAGKYKFTLDCRQGSCPPLHATEDNAFGSHPQISITGKLMGTLEIKTGSFDPKTGAFKATAQFDDQQLDQTRCRFGQPLFGNCFEAEFDDVSGHVSLEGVELDFGSSKSGTIVPGCWTANGFCNYVIGGNFSLAGAIDYRAVGTKGGDPTTFEPVMSGPVGGAGDSWSACHENQNNCSPPPTPDKSLATDLGNLATVAGIDDSIAKHIPGLGVWSAILALLAADPPDSHFRQVTPPPAPPAVRFQSGGGLTAVGAAALTRMEAGFARAAATSLAFLDAVQRYQGAGRAAEPQWLSRQRQAVITYGRQLASRCRELAATIKRDRGVLLRTPLGRTKLSRRAARSMLHRGRHRGYPASITRLLARWGIDRQAIDSARKRIPARVPHGATQPLAAVLQPSFRDELLRLADGLDH